jgi:hypothetical protein
LRKTEQLSFRKQMEIDQLKIQIITLNEEKREASSLCKAMYEQSIIYYNNFKAIESEYLKTCKNSLEMVASA